MITEGPQNKTALNRLYEAAAFLAGQEPPPRLMRDLTMTERREVRTRACAHAAYEAVRAYRSALDMYDMVAWPEATIKTKRVWEDKVLNELSHVSDEYLAKWAFEVPFEDRLAFGVIRRVRDAIKAAWKDELAV